MMSVSSIDRTSTTASDVYGNENGVGQDGTFKSELDEFSHGRAGC